MFLNQVSAHALLENPTAEERHFEKLPSRVPCLHALRGLGFSVCPDPTLPNAHLCCLCPTLEAQPARQAVSRCTGGDSTHACTVNTPTASQLHPFRDLSSILLAKFKHPTQPPPTATTAHVGPSGRPCLAAGSLCSSAKPSLPQHSPDPCNPFSTLPL